MKKTIARASIAAALALAAGAAVAATPKPFTATYEVQQGGEALGKATVTLKPASGGEWVYDRSMQGTGGIAAMLGANVQETSRLRWKGDVPEAISYDFQLQSALKPKQRHMKVDWASGKVQVDQGKHPATYAAKAGMVERNTLPLAVGLALRDGQRQIALPVAVRQEVETQNFKAGASETVKVPAGSFQAVRVDRTDADQGFSAWYAPDRYPLPVKLQQKDGGDLTMQLVSFKYD